MIRQTGISERALLHGSGFRQLKKYWQLYVLLLPALLYIIVFHYVPMYGIVISFQNYKPGMGVFGSKWIGFENFRRFLSLPQFREIFLNTLLLSLYHIVVSFPLPIVLALALNRVGSSKFRKVVQTITYAPHFISTVVVVGIVLIFLSPNSGIFNNIIALFGGEKIFFMGKPEYFRHIYVWSGIWQGVGWGSIIYLAAISAVDTALYESATLDGASMLQQAWYIDIPCIMPTIMIQLILSAGQMLNVGFEKVLLLQNSLNIETSEVISTYVYKVGLIKNQYSFSAAIGMFNSVINFVILLTVNRLAKSAGHGGLF